MKLLHKFGLAALALLLASPLAIAQVPSLPNSPYNVPMSSLAVSTPIANKVLTLTASSGTVNSGILNNIAYKGVICTFNQASHVNTPSSLLSIRYYDSASATEQQLVVSGAITADATPTSVMVYPGASLTTTPTGMVLEAIKLPRYFKVRVVTTGAAATTTGTVGCDLLN